MEMLFYGCIFNLVCFIIIFLLYPILGRQNIVRFEVKSKIFMIHNERSSCLER